MATAARTLYGIQKLRAIAAFAVVFFHVFEFLHANSSLGVPRLTLGMYGVDLFFVISGFIMVQATREGETPAGFMAKRIARIVPLYWAATLAAAAMAALVPWALQNADLSAGGFLTSLAFIPARDLSGQIMPILFVGWSLNMEMMFYVLFALTLFLPRGMRLVALVAAMGAILLACRYVLPESAATTFFARPIMLEFAAGCLIAAGLKRAGMAALVARVPMWPLQVAAFALFGIVGVWLAGTEVGGVLVAVASVLLVFATAGADLYRTSRPGRVLVPLGDASYSAYLLHPMIIPVVGIAAMKLLGDSWAAAALTLAATVVATAIVSRLSFVYFERPSNRLLRRKMTPRPA
ncbi:MAG: acyltransferase [Hyphomonas sp.]|nr:acyltransferase [Hyphomonas sp.]